jgi:hypothetical protein
LEDYAKAKKIRVEDLRSFGLTQIYYIDGLAVKIPYLDAEGSEVAVRFRVSMDSPERFRWRRGDKPRLYGLWRLQEAREAGYAVIVEGESDCHTLWLEGVPAVGVPGANGFRTEWADDLDGIERLYVVVEDEAGEGLCERLVASPLEDRLYRVELEAEKDASNLYLRDPEGFGEALRAALDGALPFTSIRENEAAESAQEAWAACKELANTEDILARFGDELGRMGVAGDLRTARLLYLALTSRHLPRPVSVAVKGPSSGGKSFAVEQVLRFFPADAFYELTAMSERALAYSEEPIEHRFLVLAEAAGMSGDFQTYLIRSLLSEGRLRYELVEKTSEGLRPRLIEREGPTGLIVTTTSDRMHPENETRLLSVTVDDTSQQTRSILKALASETVVEPYLEPWLALQRWIAQADHDVTIPYAVALAEHMPALAVRLRRDFMAVLTLIRAHAILHQATRSRDAEGRIVAETKDYIGVRGLVADLVAEGVEATVPVTVRETVNALGRLLADNDGAPVSVGPVAQELKLDNSAASRRLRSAINRGYVKNLEDRRGRAGRYVLGEPMPEDLEILPAPEVLQPMHRCSPDQGNTHAPSPDEDIIRDEEEVFEMAREYFGLDNRKETA